MRRTLLVSAAVGSVLIGIGGAQAAGLVPPDLMFSQPYVEFGGGFNFTSVTLGDLETNYCPGGATCPPTETQTAPLGIGGTFYGAVGAQVMPGLRVELQGSLRSNSGAHFDVSGEGNGSVGVDTKTFMLLGNIWKDFDLGNGFSVHVGGGLGLGSKTITVSNGATPATQTVAGLAFLAGIGGDYKLSNNMALTFDYALSNVSGTFGRTRIPTNWGNSEDFTGQFTKGMDESATIGLRFALAP